MNAQVCFTIYFEQCYYYNTVQCDCMVVVSPAKIVGTSETVRLRRTPWVSLVAMTVPIDVTSS